MIRVINLSDPSNKKENKSQPRLPSFQAVIDFTGIIGNKKESIKRNVKNQIDLLRIEIEIKHRQSY
jgi:hypothetical protein